MMALYCPKLEMPWRISSKFPFQYWLAIEFVSNCFVSSTFFISSTCWRSMSVWQETVTLNFVFLKEVVVVFQRNISRNAENFGGKFVYVVIASVLFSPLIRPFSRWFGLLRTVCWLNIVGTVPRVSSVFGAYMQVLYGRELLISATTEGTPFLS